MADVPERAPQDVRFASTEPADARQASIATSSTELRRMLALISAGLLITSLGQPGVIGQLPFLFLFKNEFHFNAAEQANFFAIATFAWYLKPLAGLLCDSFPVCHSACGGRYRGLGLWQYRFTVASSLGRNAAGRP